MPQQSELRLFISSTFRDLQEEREHLVKKIFPEIRALCRERGITFTEVDLRWGITEEEAERDGIIRICLDEIDRCRPYFIGILGERYGWSPSRREIDRLVDRSPGLASALIDGASITEMEIVHGVLANPEMMGHAFFYFRDRAATRDEFVDANAEAIGKLNDLKTRIRYSGFPVRENYRSPRELGSWIERDLRTVIDSEFPVSDVPDALELERRAHSAFAASRRRAYVANADYRDRFIAWEQGFADVDRALTHGRDSLSPSPHRQLPTPLVITGVSGLGKSSLAAHLIDDYRTTHPTAFIIEHYVGASQASGSAASVMRHIMAETRDRFAITDEIPTNPEDLEKAFPNWLFRAAHKSKESGIEMLIVVDALNQLDEAGRRLAWLPKTIPSWIRLVVSTTPGECADALRDRSWSRLEVTPIEVESVREQIVQRYLGEFRKSITSAQMHRLTRDPKASVPLYLRAVAEELRLHGEHETLDDTIARYCHATDLLAVFDQMLERLETDYSREGVREILRLIAASRSGLSELELLELTGMSRMELSRLLFALDYHLILRDGLLGFFHDYLRRAVEQRYLLDDDAQRDAHLQVATYFQNGVTASVGTHGIVPLRMAGELVYQLHAAREFDRLREWLSTIPLFLTLFQGPGQYEVLAYWSAMEGMYDMEQSYRAGLRRWSADDARQRSVGLGMVAHLLQRVGRWSGAMQIEQERLASAIGRGDRSQEAAARMGLGQMLQLRGEQSKALVEFEQALVIYSDSGDRSGISRAVGNVGVVHYRRGEYDRALECYRQQLDIGEQMGDRTGIARAIGNMGGVYYNRGEYTRALECYRQKLSIGEELGDRDGISAAVGNMGGVYYNLGEYDRALECYKRKLSIDEQIGDHSGVATALGNIGLVYADRGDYENALESQQRQLRICEELGDRHGVAVAIGNMGLVYADRGEYDRALESHQRQLSMCEELGDRTGVAIAIGNIGPIQRNRGEHDLALESYEQQLRICEELGDRRSAATAVGNMGLLYADLEEYERALACLHRAVDEHRAAGLRFGLIYCLEGIARALLDLVGRDDDTATAGTIPDSLSSYVPGATVESWRPMSLRTARAYVDECIALSDELSKPDTLFSGRVLLARIITAEGGVAIGVPMLRNLLDNADDDAQRADIHYWLWKLNAADRDHRSAALRLYQCLYQQIPQYVYRMRITELE